MSADIATSLYSWSTTASSNQPQGSTAISTNLDDNLRQIQAVVRNTQARDTISSASTCDIGAKDAMSLDVTGVTTITALGTVAAGIRKWLTFSGALTLTYNATSLILPTAASITTAAGDVACFESLGSGNWRCLSYTKANGQTIALSTTFGDGTVSVPGIGFTSDTNTGFYRIGADNIGVTVGGTKVADIAGSTLTLSPGGANYSFGTGLTLTTVGTGSGANLLLSSPNTVGGGGTGAISLTTGNDTLGTAGAMSFSVGSGYTAGSSLALTAGSTIVGGSTTCAAGSINIAGGSVASIANGTGGSVNISSGNGNDVVGDGAIRFKLYNNRTQYTIAQFSNRYRAYLWDSSAGVPTIVSGAGTGATIIGTNYGFTVTIGTTPSATVVVDLAVGSSAPAFLAIGSSSNSAYSVGVNGSGTNRVTFVCSTTPTAGDKLSGVVSFYA